MTITIFKEPEPVGYTYSVCCTECKKKATFTSKDKIRGFTLRQLHDGGLEGWIESPTISGEFAHIPCNAKKQKEQSESEDIFERIRGGRFNSDSPNFVKKASFYDEAVEYAGLTGHPKAQRAYCIAAERYENHYEMVNIVSSLKELAELILN